LNKYLISSIFLLISFVLLSVIVSPRLASYSNISASLKGDTWAFLQINNHHSASFNKLMIWLTEYGREVFWIVTILLLFIFGRWSGRKTVIIIAISILVLIPLGTIAKDIIARHRPAIPKSDFLIAADTDYSFPSGHAVVVSAGAAVALALFRDTYKKLAISVLLAIEAAFVCISRVYVGGHYPLDVLGGILLGVGVAFIFVGIEGHLESLYLSMRKILKH
jgi:undecaprenyl-diphosphatase